MVTPARGVDDDALIGQLIQDRYRILRSIARGGMGAVYEAEHERIGKRLAIKILLPAFSDRPEMLLRFQREAKAASAIGHPGIVDVSDMGELPDGTPYMALELLQGMDWETRIVGGGPQSVGSTVRLLRRVCDALGAAHEAGIVHRDIKPANVFLVEGDEIKLLDFGIARFRPDGAGEATLTQTGVALGTVRYMSPEQAKGAKVDHRTDLWALGVVLFYALTGVYPFDDASMPMLIVKICTEEPPSLGERRRDVPEGLDAIVQRLLAHDPDARFQSCAALSDALLPFAEGDQVPELRDDAPDRRAAGPTALSSGARGSGSGNVDPVAATLAMTRSPGSTSVRYALAFVLLAAVAGGAGWWALRGDDADGATTSGAPQTEPVLVGAPADPPVVDALESASAPPEPGENPSVDANPVAGSPAVEEPVEVDEERPTAVGRRRTRRSVSPPPNAEPDRAFRTSSVSADEF